MLCLPVRGDSCLIFVSLSTQSQFDSTLHSSTLWEATLPWPMPLTGCVKDLDLIWHLSSQDITSDPRPYGRSSIASLRHGNSFPLANKAILDQASITGRQIYRKESKKTELLAQPVTVHVTYILPIESKSSLSYHFWLSRMIAAVELFLLAGASISCFA